MKEIIDWLISVEQLANDFFYRAAKLYPEDRELTKFLKHLADEEAYHYHIMGSAADYVSRSREQLAPSIIVDAATKEKIETPFIRSTELIENNNLSKNMLIDCIIESEFSEWNEIFIYVINFLKTRERIFEHAAAKIQFHLNHIKHYLGTTDYGQQKLDELVNIPVIWSQRILVVDDDEAILSLLAAVLESEWKIDTARNGKEALEKIHRTHYDLIISDIDMPIMDGMELFRHLSSFITDLNKIFIFHTGDLSPERTYFFKQNNITALAKPLSLTEINSAIRDKLMKYTIEAN